MVDVVVANCIAVVVRRVVVEISVEAEKTVTVVDVAVLSVTVDPVVNVVSVSLVTVEGET
jgi:hypothetical protein